MRKVISLVTALMLLLTACGSSNPATDSATDNLSQEESTSALTTITYGMPQSWDSLMPYYSTSGSNYARLIYDKIYDRLAYVAASGEILPRGADSWESNLEGYGILFTLNSSATFHDGTPVTAQHWADTFTLMTDPDCPMLGREHFAGLVGTDDSGAQISGMELGVTVVNDYQLQLTFKVPTVPEDFLTAKNSYLYVLPTHLLEGVAPDDVIDLDLWKAPIGSGPCVFVSQQVGSQIVLDSYEDYHLGQPGFDQLIITVVDKTNLLTALISGDLDYYAVGGNITVEDAEIAEAYGLEVVQGTVPNSFYELMLNNTSLDSASLRRGLELALDKELLCAMSSQGLGTVTDTELSPNSAWYPEEPVADRDLEQAMTLLAEGGYTGETLTLACTSTRASIAALMQQNLAEAGVSVQIITVDSATLFAGFADGSYDMAIASHTPSTLPLWFVETRLTEENDLFHIQDYTPYYNLIGEIQGETEAVRRADLIESLRLTLAEERPFIPLWFTTALHVQSPTIEGIAYSDASFSNENVWEWQAN